MNYYSRLHLDSFDKVAAHYGSIKPIVSNVVLASTNLRPIYKRANKHEYIKKFSENCYAVCMAGLFSPTNYQGEIDAVVSDADQLRGAPIVWRRTKSGETITIHNDVTIRSTGWYGLLNACLPAAISFNTYNGAHALSLYGRNK